MLGGNEDPDYFHYEKQPNGILNGALDPTDVDMDQQQQQQAQYTSIDRNLLMQDEEGRVLLEEFGAMNKDYRGFIEHQRKQHEQLVREQKDFMALINRIKTN